MGPRCSGEGRGVSAFGRLWARFVSSPPPCPNCGAARVASFEPECCLSHWTCPNIPEGPPLRENDGTNADMDLAIAEQIDALDAWVMSDEYEQVLAHRKAAEIALWDHPDIRADLAIVGAELREASERADRYERALRTIQQWDCLNPPNSSLLSDLPWLRSVVDDALEGPPPSDLTITPVW